MTWLAAKARSLADSSCSFWSSCRLVLASYTLAISSLIWRAAVRAASLVLRAVLHSQRCISLHCQQVIRGCITRLQATFHRPQDLQ